MPIISFPHKPMREFFNSETQCFKKGVKEVPKILNQNHREDYDQIT